MGRTARAVSVLGNPSTAQCPVVRITEADAGILLTSSFPLRLCGCSAPEIGGYAFGAMAYCMCCWVAIGKGFVFNLKGPWLFDTATSAWFVGTTPGW